MKRTISPSNNNREKRTKIVDLTENDPNELGWADRQRLELQQERLDEAEDKEKTSFYRDLHRESYPNAALIVSGQIWTKRSLPLLYEDPRKTGSAVEYFFQGKPRTHPQDLHPGTRTKVYTKIHDPELVKHYPTEARAEEKDDNATPIKDSNGRPILWKENNLVNRTFWWSTKKKKNLKSLKSIKERDEYLQEFPSKFPYLFGRQHYNRLIRGTKVYILEGEFKNYFGTIVGYRSDFETESEALPILRILITDAKGLKTPVVQTVSQSIVKIIDFFNRIGFAVPTSAPESKSI